MKPKLPSLYRIRHDLTWDDVIRNWKEQKHSATGEWLKFEFLVIMFFFYLQSMVRANTKAAK